MPKHAHAYSNGHLYSNPSTFSISPHRFQPRTTPSLRWRRQLVFRILILALISATFLLIIFPSFRSLLLPTVGLGGMLMSDGLSRESVRVYDLNNVQGTPMGWERGERILMCVPLRDAAPHLPMFFDHLRNFTYPHHLIDLAFLVSDSKDNTLALLDELLEKQQADPDPKQPYGEITVIEKDFGQVVSQDSTSRHGFAAQAPRRKLMARARNWLLSTTLRPYHTWVYWRDADVETAPPTILEDLMRHNKDVIVPNVWRPLPDWLGGEQPYDLNSWQESETALQLAQTLDEDAVIVEGYAEYATWRPHLAYLRDPYGNPDTEMELDGVGGVSILAKARVFRAGVHFPAFSYERHAETEGFGKMARRMKFSVIGLPHYTIWHIYEPSADDLLHMEKMKQEREAKEREEAEKAARAQKVSENFQDKSADWQKEKAELIGKAKQELEESLKKKVAEAKLDSEGKDLEGGGEGPVAKVKSEREGDEELPEGMRVPEKVVEA